jgi:carboxyl-terminal processing protease
MKHLYSLILCLLIVNINVIAQELSSTEKLNSLCKVWGFLKYHHPAINEGGIDFDQELFEKLDEINLVQTKVELNQFYTNWIGELNKLNKKKKYSKSEDLLPEQKERYDKWSSQNDIYGKAFTDAVYDMMKINKTWKNIHYVAHWKQGLGSGEYISKNEKNYDSLVFPNEKIQLLALFRYWNVIDYFYPHRPSEWDEILLKYIRIFNTITTKIDYMLAIKQISSELNDGHTELSSSTADIRELNLLIHKYQFPFKSFIQSDYVVVLHVPAFYQSGLQIGDTIIAIDNIAINEKTDSLSQYESASNQEFLLEYCHTNLFSGLQDSFQLTVIRGLDTIHLQQNRYTFYELMENFPKDYFKTYFKSPKPDSILEISHEIIYINPEPFKPKQITELLENSCHYKTIIMDMRGYPHISWFHFTGFISKEKRHFSTTTRPEITQPGVFHYGASYTGSIGEKSKKQYTGNIILLVNVNTMSGSEYTCMALQSFDNVTTIGTTTAGADGNVAYIPLPGGFKTSFSGLGVYYPDNTIAQFLGVKIDKRVNVTAQSLIDGEDLILNEAIKFAKEIERKDNVK